MMSPHLIFCLIAIICATTIVYVLIRAGTERYGRLEHYQISVIKGKAMRHPFSYCSFSYPAATGQEKKNASYPI